MQRDMDMKLGTWVERLVERLPATSVIPLGFAELRFTLSLDPPSECTWFKDWDIPLLPVALYTSFALRFFGWGICRYIKIY